jgi:hypothetical protein
MVMSEYAERFPQTIIDSEDQELFKLMKDEADNFFDGEVNEELIYKLIVKDKMIRFSHDFKNNKLFIDFPKITSQSK